MTTKFADIIVPLPLAQTYTYSIPEDMENQIAVGMRVIVHFGTSKFYTGIVANIHSNHPAYDKIKPISEIIDDKPILLPSQLQLWNFVSQYYQSALGDVYKTALPSGLKIENESIIELVPEILESHDSKFSKSEQKIIDTLSDEKSHSITEFTVVEICVVKHLHLLVVLNYLHVILQVWKMLKLA
jgi:primosomal protein N' (replication factor Y)